jgi:hypothetical protein
VFEFVDELLKLEAEVVVTITAPLDRRRPGNDEDRIRLQNLQKSAEEKVRSSYRGASARRVLDRLAAAFADAHPLQGGDGIVLVATPERGEFHILPFPVRASVAVGANVATRMLVQGLRRSPRFRVLVLSDRSTRLFESVRDEAAEVRAHGFPMEAEIVRRDRRAVAGRFALSPGRDDSEQWRRFYRQVDAALTDASRKDPLPVVLVGVERTLTMFEESSNNTRSVIGRVVGAHDDVTPHAIGRAAWSIVRESLRQRRREVVEQLRDAVGTGKGVTGIDEVWQLGRQGRGLLLVVEEDFAAAPAREVDGRLVRAEPGAVGAMDDPVDDIIEHVVNMGGTAEFVAADALAAFDRIGLVLR